MPPHSFDLSLLACLVGQTQFYFLLARQGKLLDFRCRGLFDWNQELPGLHQGGDALADRIPCQIILCGFGQVVALPDLQKFSCGMVADVLSIYLQIGVHILIPTLEELAPVRMVFVFVEIGEDLRVGGAAGAFISQKMRQGLGIHRGQVGNGDGKSGGRLLALRLRDGGYRL